MLKLTVLNVSNSAAIAVNSTAVSLDVGAGAAAWLCAAGGGSPLDETCDSWSDVLAPLGTAPNQAVLLTELSLADGTVQYSSFELLATPAAMLGALPEDDAALATAFTYRDTEGQPREQARPRPPNALRPPARSYVKLT